ncbi:unnamed protein product [Urochloa decumbens]|uniref:Receptor kinase-like protein Xa21 n=1 Tax=Urochloa decumbens TaxID=240449 RepID=A0ABC9FPP7_9POAL
MIELRHRGQEEDLPQPATNTCSDPYRSPFPPITPLDHLLTGCILFCLRMKLQLLQLTRALATMLLVRTRYLLLHLLLLSTAATTNRAAASSSPSTGHGGDEAALLAFKARISGHSGVLDSWNQSTSYCSWEGVTCGKRHRWRVVTLNLTSQGLGGTISPAIGNLTFLRILDLSINTLDGEIPPSIGSLRRLQKLDLNTNMLTGVIPSNISRCVSLRVMYIHSNKGVQGSIPAEIGSMPSLSYLVLFNNSITGTIPPSLGNLSQLTDLSLSLNYLEGSIPEEIGNNPHLSFLQLSINNLSATICMVIDAGLNSLTGVVPSELGRFQNFIVLRIEKNIFEANNEEEWEFIASLTNCSNLQMLELGWNKFAGKLPSSLANLSTNLLWLRINSNNISGGIPSEIGNLANLQMLELAENLLSGDIPQSIGKLTQLKVLHLHTNSLSGVIPSSIGNLTSLHTPIASRNNLEGPIPPSFGNLNKLWAIDLSRNKLAGIIPNEIMHAFSNSIYFDLSNNLLEGQLPVEVGHLVNLEQLILSGNKLSGEIPGTIGNCRVLETLLMDGNSFQGSIPATFKNMAGLNLLNLTNNKLNGSIPGNLASITNLQELYLAHNNFSGTIPEFSLRIAIPTAGAFLLSLFIVWAGFLNGKMNTAPKKEIPPQFTEIELPIVPYNDILKGTDGFSEANLLGKGRYGRVYKGTLENQASVVAVKVFNLQLLGSYKSFLAECEALRRVRHRCLVKIVTCCSSIDHQGEDFRALVFQFMANSSLDRWIHSNFETQNGQGALRLSQRLDIAVDIADALDYLHNGCQPPIIHCDIKPSNILIDQDMRARVGDFGIARVLDDVTSKCHMNSRNSIGIRGTIGYIAPEYGEGLTVSTNGDVFSLGITLIEMFTGRSPTDDMFIDGISLHYYAEAALPDKVMEIADANIWLSEGANTSNDTDANIWLSEGANTSNDTRHITKVKECLSSVIQLGIMCSKQLPTERLSMSDAAAEMHATIRDAYTFTTTQL